MPAFYTALVSGALAGCAVDVALYPIDTIKTRMQSTQGFWAAGGFRGIYKGVNVAFIGSMPSAAMFFGTYEHTRRYLREDIGMPAVAADVISAPIGECVACFVRVPVETVKQRMQVSLHHTLSEALVGIYKDKGMLGFYRGYPSTVMREIPFGCIQFPIYEGLKRKMGQLYTKLGQPVPVYGAAICGSCAGAVAAAVTTPLDVVKTRVMLGQESADGRGIASMLVHIGRTEGLEGLFKGVGPRVMWISLGGMVFFGVYDR
eukprot:PhF_6_TR39094/c0_g1_i1/m.58508/K15111/SLC25A26; solute carrier family 25 (mitochondrial S-adenosylmethionine transporter), member 26